MPESITKSKITIANNLLLGLIILVNGYVIMAPLWPTLAYQANNHTAKRQQLKASLRAPTPTAQPNHLVVPSMLLDEPVYEGPARDQYKILNKGIWRYDRGSTPDQGGNTVLIGHRFTYTTPRGVFYHLDKVSVGDEIGLWWNNKRYLYKVSQVKTVAPTDTAIENNTSDPQLTIFTCTPLWLPKNRLAVIARLEASS